MTDQTSAGPRRSWTIGPYTFGMYRLLHWECTAHALGSSAKTPIGAFLRQRKWAKLYAAAPPWTWAE